MRRGTVLINAWFEGFPLGVKAAEQDGIGHYNQIRMNAVPFVRPQSAMTGSMAPTPAPLYPQSVPVGAAPLPTGASQLPPGVTLNEGETLVPGAVKIEDVKVGAPEPVKASKQPAGEPPKKPDTPRPAPTPDPNVSSNQPSTGFEMPELDAIPELVPRPGASYSIQDGSVPAAADTSLTNLNAAPAEPTQEEIESVIEEIFGRPAGAKATGAKTAR